MRAIRERLADILDAIERIETQGTKGKEAFTNGVYDKNLQPRDTPG